MWQIIGKVGLCVGLILCSLQDLKTKTISFYLLGGIGAFSLLCVICGKAPTPLLAVIGLLEGILLCCFSILTAGKIGMADGIGIGLCGLVFGGYVNLWIMFGSFFLAAVWGIIRHFISHSKREVGYPFYPCLTLAALGGLFL